MRPNHTFKHLIDGGFRPFRKDAVVWAKQMDEPFEVLTPEGPMRGEAGDYWCIGLGAALGRVAMHAKRVRAGKAALS